VKKKQIKIRPLYRLGQRMQKGGAHFSVLFRCSGLFEKAPPEGVTEQKKESFYSKEEKIIKEKPV